MAAIPFAHFIGLGLLLAGAAAPAEKPAAPRDGVAVHVAIDTFAIDRKGTWSAGSDEADLVPGTPGVLEKSITLVGRDRHRTQDKVTVMARLTPEPGQQEETGCALHVVFETRRAAPQSDTAAGRRAQGAADDKVDRRDATVSIAAGEERLLEVYASPVNDGRIAMRVRCAPARPAAAAIPDMVAIDLSIEKDAEQEPPEILRSQRLVATLGHETSTVVTANATLSDAEDGTKRYRRERIEAVLTPLLIVAGKLQIAVHLSGEIATVATGGKTVSYPIDRSETFLVASSEPRSFEVDVVARGTDEGWSRLRLTVDITAHF